jgi:O-antigen/teichoic acid export membrane protein
MSSFIEKILAAGERFLKIDLRYALRGGFWLTLGQVIASASSFALSIVFANALPPETYGVYRYALSIAGFLSITSLGGINTALTRSVARGMPGSIRPALAVRMKWSLLGGAAALAMAGYYAFRGNEPLTYIMLVITVFTPFFDASGVYDAYLQGIKDFKKSSFYFMAGQLASAAVMLATLLLTDNLYLIVLAYFVPWSASRAIFLQTVLKRVPADTSTDPDTVPYGKHLSFMGAISTAANYLDKLLVFHLVGPAELALYSIAVAPAEQLKMVLKNASTLALPKFSGQTLRKLQQTLWGKVAKLAALTLALSGAYIVAAPWIFKFLFPKYLAAIPFSQVFAISIVAVLTSIFTTALQAAGNTKELYQFNLVTSLVQIAFLAAGAHFFGLWGIVLARVITRFMVLGVSAVLFAKAKS